MAQPSGSDDAPVDLLGQGAAGDLLDDQAGEHVVGVAVLPTRPGGEVGRVLEGCGEQFAGGVVPDVVPEVVAVVGESAGLLEELADGDAAPVDPLSADEAGQVGVDGGVQVHPPLRDELEDDDRDEGLGVAADPHLPVDGYRCAGGQVSDSCGVGPGAAVPVPDARQGGGHPVVAHQRVQAPLDGILPGGGGLGRRQDARRHNADGERGCGRQGPSPPKSLPCLSTHESTPGELLDLRLGRPGPASRARAGVACLSRTGPCPRRPSRAARPPRPSGWR